MTKDHTTRRQFLQAATLGVVLTILASCSCSKCPQITNASKSATASQYTVACFYFPGYHPNPHNQRLYHGMWGSGGKGWTEWEVVKHARPRFAGHQQPKVPLWGYEDESDPVVMAKKIDAAADHGIDVFIFDWYWFDEGPALELALDKGFFGAPNNNRLKFSLMWANHSPVTPATFDILTDHVIKNYFHHPSYWTLDGRPFFSIYELHTLIKGLGGLKATREALQRFRDKTKAAGFPDLHLNAVLWGLRSPPGQTPRMSSEELASFFGFDSVTSYVWGHHTPLRDFPQTPYQSVIDKVVQHWQQAVKKFGIYFPNVSMGSDTSPRADQSKPYVNKGYPFLPTMSGNTPQAFKQSLVQVKKFLAKRPADQRIFTINNWNEWTEGSYLEPDTVHGMAYLEAIKEVFGNE